VDWAAEDERITFFYAKGEFEGPAGFVASGEWDVLELALLVCDLCPESVLLRGNCSRAQRYILRAELR